MADTLLFHSHRVLPEATLASGYAFRHPQLAAGLRSALE
jgi:NAD dependent epimerase/dehydratase family enzyme